jgi:Thylakoid formation protein
MTENFYTQQIDEIFNKMMIAVGFEPQKIRDDAKRMLGLIKDGNPTADDILNSTEGELAEILINVRTNRFFKYTDAWGVGLGRMIELLGAEPNLESFDKWSASLRWIFTPRLISTWDEFCGDQLRMQGIEAMQKQLMIREKKRSATRLEKKASEFEDKKKALQLLNEDIEERRQQLIGDQMALKKKYEPDEYERILLQDKTDLAAKSL